MATNNRPSLTISLADRLASSKIAEASAPKDITIVSQFATGFVPNMQQMQTNFTFKDSIFVSGLDTTVYDVNNNIQ
jgi:hypothetical protein